MIVILITYEPDKKHLVTMNGTDGAYKVYFDVHTDDFDMFNEYVDDKSRFRVYHRRSNDVNFIYLGDTVYSSIFHVEDSCKLSLFFAPDQVKKRTLFAPSNAYVSAVASECGYDGDVNGEFFLVSQDTLK